LAQKISPDYIWIFQMKILLLAYYYPPIASAGGERPLKMAKYLPLFGHEVFVLSAVYCRESAIEDHIIRIYDPSHNKNRRKLRKWQWLFFRLWTECLNLTGIYYSIYTPWKKAVIRRSDAVIRELKPDLILATYPPLECLEIGLYLKIKYQIPLLADFRDGLLFEAVEIKRMARFGCIRRHYAQIEKEAAAAADGIITISPALSHYFSQHYGIATPLTMTNGFDADDFTRLPGGISLEKSKFNIVHTGNFGLSEPGRRPDGFIAAMQDLADHHIDFREKIRLHLLGQLNRREKKLLKKLLQYGMIIYHGEVPRPQALAFQKNADLLLLITSTNQRSVASGKLFEYLFAGKPILGLTWCTYAAEIIRETGSGWVIHPDRHEEISSGLWAISTDPALINSLERKDEIIASFSRRQQMQKLATFIHSLLKTEQNS
jgi:glycosyltransferase involved in cell wall biosynthesis